MPRRESLSQTLSQRIDTFGEQACICQKIIYNLCCAKNTTRPLDPDPRLYEAPTSFSGTTPMTELRRLKIGSPESVREALDEAGADAIFALMKYYEPWLYRRHETGLSLGPT